MEIEFSSWFKYKGDTSSSSYMSSGGTNELEALAHGPLNACSYASCIVNGIKFVVHSRDVRRTTQNSGIVSIGEDGTPFYGQLEQIIQLNYIHGCSVLLFRCKWFDTSGKRVIKKNNSTIIDVSREWFVGNEWYDTKQYILATQAKQVFYLQDLSHTTNNWRVVEDVHHRKLWDHPSISVVNETDVLHDTESSDYNLVVDSDCEVDEVDVLRDTHCNIVVDLGVLPMRTTLGEGSDPSVRIPTMEDESFINDDEENEGVYDSDEEVKTNDGVEDDDDNIVGTHYYSEDTD